jgi:uncharacterized protein
MAEKVAWWLILIGALNWLFLGLFQFDVFSFLLGGQEAFWSRIVYTIIGLAGVYLLPQAFGVKMISKKQ